MCIFSCQTDQHLELSFSDVEYEMYRNTENPLRCPVELYKFNTIQHTQFRNLVVSPGAATCSCWPGSDCCELMPHSLPAIRSWAVPVAAVTLLSDSVIYPS